MMVVKGVHFVIPLLSKRQVARSPGQGAFSNMYLVEKAVANQFHEEESIVFLVTSRENGNIDFLYNP